LPGPAHGCKSKICRDASGVAAFIAAAVAVIFAVSLAALGAFMRQVAAAPDAGPMRD